VCLTSENLDAPWLLFESGAISKMKDAKTCTFLLDVTSTDVKLPLAQFQHTMATKEDAFRLVKDMNAEVRGCGERSLADQKLIDAFDLHWPRLASELERIRAEAGPKPTKRTDRELLEDILETVRRLEPKHGGEISLEDVLNAGPSDRGIMMGYLRKILERQLQTKGKIIPDPFQSSNDGNLLKSEEEARQVARKLMLDGASAPSVVQILIDRGVPEHVASGVLKEVRANLWGSDGPSASPRSKDDHPPD
jgi:hypothetical protein